MAKKMPSLRRTIWLSVPTPTPGGIPGNGRGVGLDAVSMLPAALMRGRKARLTEAGPFWPFISAILPLGQFADERVLGGATFAVFSKLSLVRRAMLSVRVPFDSTMACARAPIVS